MNLNATEQISTVKNGACCENYVGPTDPVPTPMRDTKVMDGKANR